jgi:hypothetical protein
MDSSRLSTRCRFRTVFAGLVVLFSTVLSAQGSETGTRGDAGSSASACDSNRQGSPFVPVDNWIYPALFRLYGLGFGGHMFLGMRPWTRASIHHMLDDVADQLQDADPGPEKTQAQELYDAITRELSYDPAAGCTPFKGTVRPESVYSQTRVITGTPLRDSYHLGSSIVNDYGRPYANGVSSYIGLGGYATAGRFTLYARAEFHGTPSAAGYSPLLAGTISNVIDLIPYLDPETGLPYKQATIPAGPIPSITRGRLLEAYASAHILNHEISIGKQDEWMGTARGGGFAYSNNAENIYAFHINRVEPLHVPGLSYFTGPFRYEFLIGGLRGHTYVPNPAYPPAPGEHLQPNVITPGNSWVHIEKVSFTPTENLEFGFERTAIWGGQGHGPITLHTFLTSFFSFASPTIPGKYGRNDPGARFGAFDFSYRLPFVRKLLTLYADGEVHDDVSAIDAPRRASWRPGLYLSHVPGIPRMDIRLEAVETDPPVSTSRNGTFMYFESVQRQGYTNNGQIFGDWIGREGKGGQTWITYNLSGNEWLQVSARNQKVAKDFIRAGNAEYGTTLNDVTFQAVKRLGKDLEIDGSFTWEKYKAPIYLPGEQAVTIINVRLTWYPTRQARKHPQ